MTSWKLVLESIMKLEYLENIPEITHIDMKPLWESGSVITVLADMDNYDDSNMLFLDSAEKQRVGELKTEYFRKRFILSRTFLKLLIGTTLNRNSPCEISLYKDQKGKIHVREHNEFNICISYTENIIAMGISKPEIGIDIEKRIKRKCGNFSKRSSVSCDHVTDKDSEFLTIWTLKEAYCKFANEKICSYIKKEPEFENIWCLNYMIEGNYILAIVADSEPEEIKVRKLKKLDIFQNRAIDGMHN